jgi:hypothetical protein
LQVLGIELIGGFSMEAKEDEYRRGRLDRFLKSKTWSIIQIVIPLFAIAVPIVIYVVSQKSGQITVSGVQKAVLLDPASEIAEGVNLLYKNVQIGNITKYVLKIKNTGNRDIDRSDIHYLRWFPPKGSQILNSEIIHKTAGYGDFISLDHSGKDKLEINILTLNRNVFATIGVLCSCDIVNVDVSTSRVEGVVKGASIVDQSTNFQAEVSPSFLQNVFAGGIWTNFAKIFIFLAIFVVLIIVIIGPISAITKYIGNRRRSSHLARIKDDIEYFIVENKINEKDREYVEQSFVSLRKLTTPQLEAVSRLIDAKYNMFDFVLNERLKPQEKEHLRSIADKEFIGKEVITYPSLYESRKVIDYLLKKRGSNRTQDALEKRDAEKPDLHDSAKEESDHLGD